MDLHDFRDVAENYDRYLEVMYTQGTDHHEGFQEFYLDLARKYGSGGVVDVACGTGAVLLYLAERGIDVDGTDLSGEMCKVAAAKAKALGHLAVEMESAGLYLTVMAERKKALALFQISDHVFTGEALSAAERQDGFNEMMEVALKTAVRIDV